MRGRGPILVVRQAATWPRRRGNGMMALNDGRKRALMPSGWIKKVLAGFVVDAPH